jgi:hypothetical protein
MPRSKNEWSYSSTPQYAFMAWCSITAHGQLYLYLYLYLTNSTIIFPFTPRSTERSLPFRFYNQNFNAFISLMRTTCPTYLILLDLITRIIFCEAYNLWISSLGSSLLQPPAASSLLGLNIHLSILFSSTSIYIVPSVSEAFYTHKNNELYPHSPNMPSWRCAQLKHRDNFIFLYLK